jgi:hypothetical protein
MLLYYVAGRCVYITVFTRIKDDPAYNMTPPRTIFNFHENTNIHISQVFMSITVCIFNILELNNYLSQNIYVINNVNCISQS